MRNFVSVLFATVFFVSLACSQAVFAGGEYPLRAKYPDVKVISTEQMAADYDKTIIVDVRSKMEFDVAHVNKAKHVSISTASFTKDLEAVRVKDGAVLLAFYCNGHTCSKSYKAVKKAAGAGFTNIVAYDSGIFDWIVGQPDKATLMGETPASKDKVIPKSELKKKFLNYADFSAKAGDANSVIIDIRDPMQRKKNLDIPKVRNVPLDRLLKLLAKKQFQDKQVLFVDAVGKQVRWLQYHLVKNGYTNYYFLEKGVTAVP